LKAGRLEVGAVEGETAVEFEVEVAPAAAGLPVAAVGFGVEVNGAAVVGAAVVAELEQAATTTEVARAIASS
jgi:hypothetical protein